MDCFGPSARALKFRFHSWHPFTNSSPNSDH
jgi:hypothetical protein